MPMRAEKISLTVAGKLHSDWQHYDIDSDLMIPADAWSLTLAPGKSALPDVIEPGATVEIRVDDELILTGIVDDVDTSTTATARTAALSGRDRAGQLLDCSAEVFSSDQKMTLAQIANQYNRRMGIKLTINSPHTELRERVSVEPGDTIWAALQHAAEANGLWPWFEPDGTLMIGGPDYEQPPVARLVLRTDGKDNNVEEVRVKQSLRNRYSQLTVLGQAPGTYLEDGNSIKATAKDTGVKLFRPRIVSDHEAENKRFAQDRARKLLADGRLEGCTVVVRVAGHRRPDGELWRPGVRVECDFQQDKIAAVMFLMGRRFYRGIDGGSYTELRFKEDGTWVLDAHPHNRKYRLGRNQLAGKIVDIDGEAS